MKRKITKTGSNGFILLAAVLAIAVLNLTGCGVIANRQAVSDSLMIPGFAMVISTDEAPFMMGSDKNGALYCFNQGMRMELRGYMEGGQIYINPGAIGTHELQHVLNCIDPVKYGDPDGNRELITTKTNGVKLITKRGTY